MTQSKLCQERIICTRLAGGALAGATRVHPHEHCADYPPQKDRGPASFGQIQRRSGGVILPIDSGEDAVPAAEDATAGAAWDAFLRAGRRLERRFRPGVSGVRLLSTM